MYSEWYQPPQIRHDYVWYHAPHASNEFEYNQPSSQAHQDLNWSPHQRSLQYSAYYQPPQAQHGFDWYQPSHALSPIQGQHPPAPTTDIITLLQTMQHQLLQGQNDLLKGIDNYRTNLNKKWDKLDSSLNSLESAYLVEDDAEKGVTTHLDVELSQSPTVVETRVINTNAPAPTRARIENAPAPARACIDTPATQNQNPTKEKSIEVVRPPYRPQPPFPQRFKKDLAERYKALFKEQMKDIELKIPLLDAFIELKDTVKEQTKGVESMVVFTHEVGPIISGKPEEVILPPRVSLPEQEANLEEKETTPIDEPHMKPELDPRLTQSYQPEVTQVTPSNSPKSPHPRDKTKSSTSPPHKACDYIRETPMYEVIDGVSLGYLFTCKKTTISLHVNSCTLPTTCLNHEIILQPIGDVSSAVEIMNKLEVENGEANNLSTMKSESLIPTSDFMSREQLTSLDQYQKNHFPGADNHNFLDAPPVYTRGSNDSPRRNLFTVIESYMKLVDSPRPTWRPDVHNDDSRPCSPKVKMKPTLPALSNWFLQAMVSLRKGNIFNGLDKRSSLSWLLHLGGLHSFSLHNPPD